MKWNAEDEWTHLQDEFETISISRHDWDQLHMRLVQAEGQSKELLSRIVAAEQRIERLQQVLRLIRGEE